MGLFILYVVFAVVMLLLANYYFFPKPKEVAKEPAKPEREIVYVQVPVPVIIPQPPVEEEKVDDEPYRNPIKPWEQKLIDAQMDRFLENNLNSDFFKEHPKYVDAYLSKVDISELGLDVKED